MVGCRGNASGGCGEKFSVSLFWRIPVNEYMQSILIICRRMLTMTGCHVCASRPTTATPSLSLVAGTMKWRCGTWLTASWRRHMTKTTRATWTLSLCPLMAHFVPLVERYYASSVSLDVGMVCLNVDHMTDLGQRYVQAVAVLSISWCSLSACCDYTADFETFIKIELFTIRLMQYSLCGECSVRKAIFCSGWKGQWALNPKRNAHRLH